MYAVFPEQMTSHGSRTYQLKYLNIIGDKHFEEKCLLSLIPREKGWYLEIFSLHTRLLTINKLLGGLATQFLARKLRIFPSSFLRQKFWIENRN